MEPLKPPPTFKVYTVIKQTGLLLTYVYSGSNPSMNFGPGFYAARQEAEQVRTFEMLKDTTESKSLYHVYELEIPNPAYQE